MPGTNIYAHNKIIESYKLLNDMDQYYKNILHGFYEKNSILSICLNNYGGGQYSELLLNDLEYFQYLIKLAYYIYNNKIYDICIFYLNNWLQIDVDKLNIKKKFMLLIKTKYIYGLIKYCENTKNNLLKSIIYNDYISSFIERYENNAIIHISCYDQKMLTLYDIKSYSKDYINILYFIFNTTPKNKNFIDIASFKKIKLYCSACNRNHYNCELIMNYLHFLIKQNYISKLQINKNMKDVIKIYFNIIKNHPNYLDIPIIKIFDYKYLLLFYYVTQIESNDILAQQIQEPILNIMIKNNLIREIMWLVDDQYVLQNIKINYDILKLLDYYADRNLKSEQIYVITYLLIMCENTNNYNYITDIFNFVSDDELLLIKIKKEHQQIMITYYKIKKNDKYMNIYIIKMVAHNPTNIIKMIQNKELELNNISNKLKPKYLCGLIKELYLAKIDYKIFLEQLINVNDYTYISILNDCKLDFTDIDISKIGQFGCEYFVKYCGLSIVSILNESNIEKMVKQMLLKRNNNQIELYQEIYKINKDLCLNKKNPLLGYSNVKRYQNKCSLAIKIDYCPVCCEKETECIPIDCQHYICLLCYPQIIYKLGKCPLCSLKIYNDID